MGQFTREVQPLRCRPGVFPRLRRVGFERIRVSSLVGSFPDRFYAKGDIIRSIRQARVDQFSAPAQSSRQNSFVLFGFRKGTFSHFGVTVVGIGVVYFRNSFNLEARLSSIHYRCLFVSRRKSLLRIGFPFLY